MKDWNVFKDELLQDKDVMKEYTKLAPRYAVIAQLIATRQKKGLTQKELAQKVGTKQSAIARLEAGNTNPSLGFLEKIATVLDVKLVINLQ